MQRPDFVSARDRFIRESRAAHGFFFANERADRVDLRIEPLDPVHALPHDFNGRDPSRTNVVRKFRSGHRRMRNPLLLKEGKMRRSNKWIATLRNRRIRDGIESRAATL